MDEEILETAESGESPEGGGFMDGWEETGEGIPETGAEAAGEADMAAEAVGDTGADALKDGNTAGEEAAGSGAEGPARGGEKAGGDPAGKAAQRVWTLEYRGQTVTAGEAELAALAQKGLDYDRLETEYAELRPGVELLNAFAKRAGVSLADYVTDLRVRLKQSEGMDEDAARQAVELEVREAAVSAREARERAAQEAEERQAEERRAWEARRDADIETFVQVFPEAAADPKTVPPEVWEAVRGGSSLTAAYAAYVRRQQEQAAQAEARAKAQAAENAARSTGSMRSAGSAAAGKDPFLEGWES